MITAQNLHKRFGAFHALRGISLHVRRGEIYGFIGQNGAGKTTAMHILSGLSRPTEGACIVNGKDVSSVRHPGELRIGFLPEEPKFYPWMTAHETLCYLGGKIRKARIDELLEWVGLAGAAHRRVGGFSRGMKQRLGIGAALVRDPALLILDEPASALDPEGRGEVLRLLSELKRMGKTVLFSTHILSDVERVCDTVGMIAQGRMVLEKPLEQLQSENARPIFDILPQKPFGPEMLVHLRRLTGVLEVSEADKGSLSVLAAEEAAVSKRLMRFFAEQDIAVRGFSLRKNNLEDLFMREVKADDAGN